MAPLNSYLFICLQARDQGGPLRLQHVQAGEHLLQAIVIFILFFAAVLEARHRHFELVLNLGGLTRTRT